MIIKIKNKKFFIIIFTLSLMPYFFYLLSMLPNDGEKAISLGIQGRDIFDWAGYISSLKHIFPPENPFVAGVPAKRYWLSFYPLSFFSKIFGIQSLTVLKLFTPLIGILNFLITFLLLRKFFSERTTLITSFLIFLAGSLEFLYVFLINVVHAETFIRPFMAVISDLTLVFSIPNLSLTLISNIPVSSAYFFFMLTIYSFFESFKNKKFLAIGLFSILLIPLYHIFFAIVLVFGFIGCMILKVILEKKLSKNFLVKTILFVSFLILGAIPYFSFLSGNYPLKFGLQSVKSFNGIQILFSYILVLGVPFIFGIVGLLNKQLNDFDYLIISMMFVSFIMANFLILGERAAKFELTFFITFFIYSGFGIEKFLETVNKKTLFLFLILFISIFSNILYLSGNLFAYLVELDYLNSTIKPWQVYYIPNSEIQASEWIRQHTEPNSILITIPDDNYPSEVSIAERSVYLDGLMEVKIGWFPLNSTKYILNNSDVPEIVVERYNDIYNLYSRKIVSSSFKKLGKPLYVLLREKEMNLFNIKKLDIPSLDEVYNKDNVTIYKVL